MGLIILAIGPRAGERDLRCVAPVLDRLVHEDAVIVRIEAEQRKWQRRAQGSHDLTQQALLAEQKGRTFSPSCRHIGEGQRLHEAAARRRAAMCHKIRFHVSGHRVVPIRKGPDRHAAPHRRGMGIPPTLTARTVRPDRGENPVDRGCADLAQPDAYHLVQREMAVPLHRWDQQWDERLQPLPADPVARFPEHNKSLSHRFVINPASRPGPRPVHAMFTPEEAFSVFAVIPGDFHELRQNTALLGSLGRSVTRSHRLQKFVSRRHADPPHIRPQSKMLREHF